MIYAFEYNFRLKSWTYQRSRGSSSMMAFTKVFPNALSAYNYFKTIKETK